MAESSSARHAESGGERGHSVLRLSICARSTFVCVCGSHVGICSCVFARVCVGQRLMLGDLARISHWIRSLLADSVASQKASGILLFHLPRTRIAGVYDLRLFFFS